MKRKEEDANSKRAPRPRKKVEETPRAFEGGRKNSFEKRVQDNRSEGFKKPFRKDGENSRFDRTGDKPRFDRRSDSGRADRPGSGRFDKPAFNRNSKSGERRFDKPRFDRNAELGERRFDKPRFDRNAESGERRFDKPRFDRNAESGERRFDKPRFGRNAESGERRFDKPRFDRNAESGERRFDKPRFDRNTESGERSFGKTSGRDNAFQEEGSSNKRQFGRKKGEPFEYGKNLKPQKRPDYSEENLIKNLPEKQKKKVAEKVVPSDLIRLNRYIANSGICSRREADDLIESGQITVNGKTITEMGYQVKKTDVVKYGRKILNPEKLVYVLLNKPKDFITTTEDPEGRRTVMELVAKAGPERIYPVGRLDRATTGLLLFTNDGELAEKLSHPSNEIRKIYQVEIDKPLAKEDFEKLIEGVELEDGFIKPDQVSIVTPDQQVIGIEIHSGKNRVVRRIFEHLGYEVTQLDRTTYAGLTKKDLPRGNWRFLTEKEVIRLKYMI
ncbi:RNA-binding S4 domain protein [Leadbetterella byssophila DSM 17132]|uniref:Pseudouridine synthase n=1 Tax=Leadbetterella byssophila (strain DSM 17132 / JCM 16389 / KACC 11308 / NBRC 106382 / 4M15) TaxID=649349 RepID=E4RXA2_LEAB4|nr:pseudouridine synthase [Leadbetterella byssophila]ADQ19017.1 RNA-binding S4 domain protein [Leadbetterella byssophila DSM 17132]